MKGYILLHRSILDNWIADNSKPYCPLGAWIYIILMANWKPGKMPSGGGIIHIPRGSFPTTQRKLASAWGWSQWKVRTFLSSLEADNMICVEKAQNKSIIHVVRYSVYQDLQIKKSAMTTQKKRNDHSEKALIERKKKRNKEIKKEEREKKTPPSIQEIESLVQKEIKSQGKHFLEASGEANKIFHYYSARDWSWGNGSPVKIDGGNIGSVVSAWVSRAREVKTCHQVAPIDTFPSHQKTEGQSIEEMRKEYKEHLDVMKENLPHLIRLGVSRDLPWREAGRLELEKEEDYTTVMRYMQAKRRRELLKGEIERLEESHGDEL